MTSTFFVGPQSECLKFRLRMGSQFLITKPARDRTSWSHSAETLQSPNRTKGALLIRRIEPNSTVGPVLSVRVFGFEIVYGLDVLMPSTEHPNMNAWVTACLGTKFFLLAETSSSARGRTKQSNNFLPLPPLASRHTLNKQWRISRAQNTYQQTRKHGS